MNDRIYFDPQDLSDCQPLTMTLADWLTFLYNLNQTAKYMLRNVAQMVFQDEMCHGCLVENTSIALVLTTFSDELMSAIADETDDDTPDNQLIEMWISPVAVDVICNYYEDFVRQDSAPSWMVSFAARQEDQHD